MSLTPHQIIKSPVVTEESTIQTQTKKARKRFGLVAKANTQ